MLGLGVKDKLRLIFGVNVRWQVNIMVGVKY